MEQYIPKSALVAEIEKRIESCAKLREDMLNVQCHNLADYASARIGELNYIQDFIDTFEVKEVDLEKVFNDEYSKFSNDVDAMDYSFPIDLADYKDFAKLFFELGLKAQKNEPVSDDLQEEITRYFSKNPIKPLTDWPVLKNTALHFANWQKEQKSIWHTMDETPNYPCDILFLTNVDNMFLYRYMKNGRPVDIETPYFHNILNGKCWCYCNDIMNVY